MGFMYLIYFLYLFQVNTLGPIVTMPFMISYVLVDYAYFALAMSFDKRKARDARFKEAKDLPPTFDKTVLNANGNLGKGGHTYGKSVEELKDNSTNSVPSVTFYFLNNSLSDISRKCILLNMIEAEPP